MLKARIGMSIKDATKMKAVFRQSKPASPEDSLVHDRDGWRFIAIAMLIINAIWLVFGALGYGLAGMIFR